jgi:hypothetical protein
VAISHAFSNAIADGTNTQIVRPSDWNSAHNFTQNLAGNTAGVASVAGTDIVWAGGANITLSANGSTISVVGGAGAAADGGVGISAGTASVSAGTVVFSNSGGVSFGLNGSTVTATVATNYQSQGAYLTTAALSNHSHGNPTLNLTNLSGTTASNSAGFTLSLSAVNALTTAALSNHSHGNPTLALTNLTGTTASNSAGLTLSLSAGDLGAFLTTAALSNHSHGNPTLALTNISGTTASNSAGLTLSLSAAAPGGGAGGYSVFHEQLMPAAGYLSISNFGHIQNGVAFYPVDVNASIVASALAIPVSITNSSTGSSSGQVGYTYQVGLYSQGTNTTRLDSMYTTSYTIAASNSSNGSRAVTWIDGIVNATSYSTNSSSSAGLNLSSLFHGNREIQMPFETTLAPGRYWVGCVVSTSVAGTTNGVLTINNAAWRLGLSLDMFRIGSAANNATISAGQQFGGLGAYSVTSAGLPDTVGYSELRRENQQLYPVVQLRRSFY